MTSTLPVVISIDQKVTTNDQKVTTSDQKVTSSLVWSSGL